MEQQLLKENRDFIWISTEIYLVNGQKHHCIASKREVHDSKGYQTQMIDGVCYLAIPMICPTSDISYYEMPGIDYCQSKDTAKSSPICDLRDNKITGQKIVHDHIGKRDYCLFRLSLYNLKSDAPKSIE